MPKTLVTYFSLTGNTKLIATAIHEGLDGDKSIGSISEIPDISSASLVFIGFPVHSHSVPYKAEEFMKKIPAGKKVAVFCTHGSLPGSNLSREAIEYASVLLAKARLLGTFACRGKVSLQALDVLGRSPRTRGLGGHGRFGGHASRLP